ncbi:hypothetical protein [Lentisalinibacter sediminis]|uniref:hypothetical protein n=1 Tax=Lentisalinibacter sediminis TaxID=2992237 RepID=UPI003868F177
MMRDHPLYRHRWKLLLVLAAILIALWLYPTRTGREGPVETPPPPPAAPAGTQSSTGQGEAPPTGQRLASARQTVRDLELALGAAVEERKRAEALLEQSEQDVEDLERFIEEIEQRGEDPVDYAEQGLEMFQPAFYAYQEAFSRLEQAEASEAALREELAEAEARVEALELNER